MGSDGRTGCPSTSHHHDRHAALSPRRRRWGGGVCDGRRCARVAAVRGAVQLGGAAECSSQEGGDGVEEPEMLRWCRFKQGSVQTKHSFEIVHRRKYVQAQGDSLLETDRWNIK